MCAPMNNFLLIGGDQLAAHMTVLQSYSVKPLLWAADIDADHSSGIGRIRGGSDRSVSFSHK